MSETSATMSSLCFRSRCTSHRHCAHCAMLSSWTMHCHNQSTKRPWLQPADDCIIIDLSARDFPRHTYSRQQPNLRPSCRPARLSHQAPDLVSDSIGCTFHECPSINSSLFSGMLTMLPDDIFTSCTSLTDLYDLADFPLGRVTPT